MLPELLQCQSLVAGFRNQTCAEVGDLAIQQASITVLAGPNGAGKSTLVKTLARRMAPLSGKVTIGGVDIAAMSEAAFARKVAYVPQTVDVARHLTVYEWAALGRNPHQSWWSWRMGEADKEVVRLALERTGSWEIRDRLVHTLSGGERQRVFFSMALAQESGYLLLDEPTAHLDFKHQLELAELLKDLAGSGPGILVVLHDLNLMARVADHVVFIKKDSTQRSAIISAGPKDAVLKPQVLRQVYDVEVEVLLDAESGVSGFVPVKVAGP